MLGGGAYPSVSVVQLLSLSGVPGPPPNTGQNGPLTPPHPTPPQKKEYWLSTARGALAPSRSSSSTASS